MSKGSEFKPCIVERVLLPFLLECDHCGRVLWMSEHSPIILRGTKQLIDIIAVTLRHSIVDLQISPLCFSKVCDFRGSVLIVASGTLLAPDAEKVSTLQVNLTSHFFRLLRLERWLFERARLGRGGSRSTAVRQIELERQRLARELHTGVGQMLAAIRWQLEVISTEVPSPSVIVGQALQKISTLTVQTLDQVRSISGRLHPPEWQRLTLESAMRQLWEISGFPQRLGATLRIDSLPSEPDLEVKILFYRAFQEALSNLTRHSHATMIHAELQVHGSQLVLSIRDNGVGFDVGKLLSSPARISAGIGLRSIREMAQGVGGKFEVESGRTGTNLVISAGMSVE